MKSDQAKFLRNFSRTVAWVAAVIFGLSAFAVGQVDLHGAVPIVVLSLALSAVATAAYLVLLRVAQTAAKQELEELLRSGQLFGGNAGPLILFLRSFDVAKSGLTARLFDALSFLFSVFSQSSHEGRYDVDEKLDDSVGGRGLLVAIGDKQVSYGSAKLTVRDEDWKEMFQALAKAAKLIVMLPGPSASVLWEISQLLSERPALSKTVFAMPRQYSDGMDWFGGFVSFARTAALVLWENIPQLVSGRSRPVSTDFAVPRQFSHFWARTATAVESELGVKLPVYKTKGCYFKISADGHAISGVELEAFTTALAKYLANVHSTTDRAFDPSRLWETARETGATTIAADSVAA
jgi:hypothetical protein